MSLAWTVCLACLTFGALSAALANAYGTCSDLLDLYSLDHPETPLTRLRARWRRIRRWWHVYTVFCVLAAVLWAAYALGRW